MKWSNHITEFICFTCYALIFLKEGELGYLFTMSFLFGFYFIMLDYQKKLELHKQRLRYFIIYDLFPCRHPKKHNNKLRIR